MAYPFRALTLAAVLGLMALPVRAEAPAAAGQPAQGEDEEGPIPAPLTVGSMAIASDPSLAIEGMAVDIALDRVTYAYRLHNKGNTKLVLAASVTMPDLEVNTEAASVYSLPATDPGNPVDLKVKSGDTAMATTPHLRADALGIDRLDALRADAIPPIPFSDETAKALTEAKPDVLARLQGLGLVAPRDPNQPATPVTADWILRNVVSWSETLEANATTNVTVSFAPVKAVYTIDAAGLPGFDATKDQVCLTPQITAAAKALLKAKGSMVSVADITLANDGPARWLDNPTAGIAVTKPKANSVVAFCGQNAATAGQAVVKGTMPGSADAAGLRVLIFSPADR